MDPKQIIEILHKHSLAIPLSVAEQEELNSWLELSPANQRVFAEIQDPSDLDLYLSGMLADEKTDAALQLFEQRHFSEPVESAEERIIPIQRVHFLRRWWWAAAIILVSGTITAIAVLSGGNQPQSGSELSHNSADVLPGSNKATLTLADGSAIILDSAGNGAIAQQGNSSIIKQANGEIRYDLKGVSKHEVMMNTISTPKGGQYKLILPDGTQLWLNTASSVTYPAMFVGKERKIKITGEVYLEVAANKSQPFIVDIDGKSNVQVLGTSFNINSYADEENITTTLVSGSVKINSSVMLTPGQQALSPYNTIGVSGSADRHPDNIRVASNVNMEQVLAWKNGIFSFDGKNFASLMREVERWYDIRVVYKGVTPDFKMKGKMDRGVPLNDLLRFLREYGLTVKLEGRSLIVGE